MSTFRTIPQSFPIHQGGYERGKSYPRSVPWEFVAPHAARAARNHSQSLSRLAERGGLSPMELYLVVHDLDLREYRHHNEAEALGIIYLTSEE